MDRLRSFYWKSLTATIPTIVFAFNVFYMKYFEPMVIKLTADSLSPEVLSKAEPFLLSALLLCVEYFLRKQAWKLFYQSINFNGKWAATTTYEFVEKGDAITTEGELKPAFPRGHDVLIVQDCLSIRIAPTGGAFPGWSSLAMDLQGSDELVYAYKVNYKKGGSEQPSFPDHATGCEEMSVTDRYPSIFGEIRPRVMEGKFAHCAKGQVPVYRGSVIFTRK